MSESGIITPSPALTPKSAPSYTLSERINSATRPTHSQLNRLIVARLPLALPPHSPNPNTYVKGLVHIACIYSTFEQLWQTMLDAPHLPTTLNKKQFSFDACDPDYPLIDSATSIPHLLLQHRPKVCTRTHSLLTHLHLPGLLRTARIRADIQVLSSGMSNEEMDMNLDKVSMDGPLSEFIRHIKHSVETNPHVLLAYAWVLYMALFSGGRFLRLSLSAAGPSFWGNSPDLSPFSDRADPFFTTFDQETKSSSPNKTTHDRKISCSDKFEAATVHLPNTRKLSRSDTSVSSIPTPSPGLAFFNFEGEQDGEDIKLEFKKRIAEAEILLTPGEKDDIIQEAQDIFKFMVDLIHELDRICHTFNPKDEDSDSSEESTGSIIKTNLETRETQDDSSNTESPAESPGTKNRKILALAGFRGRDSVAINHDRLRKRNDTFAPKDSVVPKELLPPKRATTISFKGDRKISFAVIREPFEKMVRWGGYEEVRRKMSMGFEGVGSGIDKGVRKLSVQFDGKVVLGSATVILAVVVIIVVMAWWMMWSFGLVE